jgi:hypothetical protein
MCSRNLDLHGRRDRRGMQVHRARQCFTPYGASARFIKVARRSPLFFQWLRNHGFCLCSKYFKHPGRHIFAISLRKKAKKTGRFQGLSGGDRRKQRRDRRLSRRFRLFLFQFDFIPGRGARGHPRKQVGQFQRSPGVTGPLAGACGKLQLAVPHPDRDRVRAWAQGLALAADPLSLRRQSGRQCPRAGWRPARTGRHAQ